MTTALGARPEQSSTHARHSAAKWSGRRRRALEKVLVAFVLFVALAVTVVLLGLQWLGNEGTPSAAAIASHNPVSEVHPS